MQPPITRSSPAHRRTEGGRRVAPSVRLLFSLRNLLSANGIFLLLAFDGRLCLFLHRLLVFGFWRFVAHEANAKV